VAIIDILGMELLCGGYGVSTITRWTYDPTTKSFTYLGNFESGNNPSWISVCTPTTQHMRAGNKLLFVANEVKNYDRSDQGAISCFRVMENGDVSFVNRVRSGGGWPCHIHCVCADSAAPYIVVSNYNDGRSCVIPYDADAQNDGNYGTLRWDKAITLIHTPSPTRTTPLTRDGPHSHNVEDHNGFLYCVDLGLDFIFKFPVSQFKFSAAAARSPKEREQIVEAKAGAGLQLPIGCGPRHIKFHPFLDSGAFVLNECTNTVMVLSVNGANGDLSLPTARDYTYTDPLTLPAMLLRLVCINVVVLVAVPFVGSLLSSGGRTNNNSMLNITVLGVVNAILLMLHTLGINVELGLSPVHSGEHKHTLSNNISTLHMMLAAGGDTEFLDKDMNASELHISKDGKYLYTATRDVRKGFEACNGDDISGELAASDRSCITVFKIHSTQIKSDSYEPKKRVNSTKSKSLISSLAETFSAREPSSKRSSLLKGGGVFLECLQIVPTMGNHPRHFFLLDEPHNQLIVSNQRSNTVVVFDIFGKRSGAREGLINVKSVKVVQGDPAKKRSFSQPAILVQL
jgi:6-phosphogluconolactonase (cycloisomerase 2 family)